MKFAKEIKRLRSATGLSQGDIAKKLNYTSPQFISNWEKGLSHPPVGAIKKLCKEYKWDYRALAFLLIEEHVVKLRAEYGV